MNTLSTYRVRPAGFISRFLAFMIDIFIISITSTLVVLGVQEIQSFFGMNSVMRQWIVIVNDSVTLQEILRIIALVVSYLYGILYFTVFWLIVGYTPGKYLLGLKVIRTDGKKLKFGRCFIRAVGYSISGLFLFLGFIWIILDRRRQSWHDKLAGTLVIYT
jgi:uncharacterized RDD family membrane protein YckC